MRQTFLLLLVALFLSWSLASAQHCILFGYDVPVGNRLVRKSFEARSDCESARRKTAGEVQRRLDDARAAESAAVRRLNAIDLGALRNPNWKEEGTRAYDEREQAKANAASAVEAIKVLAKPCSCGLTSASLNRSTTGQGSGKQPTPRIAKAASTSDGDEPTTRVTGPANSVPVKPEATTPTETQKAREALAQIVDPFSKQQRSATRTNEPGQIVDPFGATSDRAASVEQLLQGRLNALEQLRRESNETFDAQEHEIESEYRRTVRAGANADVIASVTQVLIGVGQLATQGYKNMQLTGKALDTANKELARNVSSTAYSPIVDAAVQDWSESEASTNSGLTLFGKALAKAYSDMQSPSYWAGLGAELRSGQSLSAAIARRPSDTLAEAQRRLKSLRSQSNAVLDAKIAATHKMIGGIRAARRTGQ